MPRLHHETINNKPVTFYVEDDGVSGSVRLPCYKRRASRHPVQP